MELPKRSPIHRVDHRSPIIYGKPDHHALLAGPPRSIGKQMKTRSLTHMAMGVQDFVHRRGA
jgi:hypothetical protein